MKIATRDALEKSIRSWERHVKVGGHDPYFSACALCKRFDAPYADSTSMVLRDCVREDGERCPILKLTGETRCDGTPFYDWPNDVDRAQRMLDILKDCRDV